MAYKSGIANITQDSTFMNEVSEGGNYWNAFVDATYKELILTCVDSLSEVLVDYTIEEVVPAMFGVGKDPNTWPDDVKTYSFGN